MMTEAKVHPVSYLSLPRVPSSICFYQSESAGDGFLLVGDVEGMISQYNLISWKLTSTLNPFRSSSSVVILKVETFNDDLIVQAKGEVIKRFKYSQSMWEHKQDLNYDCHLGYCRFSVEKSKKMFAFPSSDSDVVVASLDQEIDKVVRIPGLDKCGLLMSLCFLNVQDDLLLLSGYESGQLLLTNPNNGNLLSKIDDIGNVPLSLDFDEQSQNGISAGNGGTISVFKVENSQLSKVKIHSVPTEGISEARIRKPDKKIVICGCWDNTIRLFSWKNPTKLKPLGALKFHTDSVQAVVSSGKSILSRGGTKLLAAAGKDKVISFWNVYSTQADPK